MLSRLLAHKRTGEFLIITVVGVNEGGTDEQKVQLRILDFGANMIVDDISRTDFSVRLGVEESLATQGSKMLVQLREKVCVLV